MSITVKFSVVTFIDRETTVSVLGSVPELGSWNQKNRIELTQSDSEFRLGPGLEPSFWSKDVEMSFNGKSELRFEYKFVSHKNGNFIWEGEGPCHNRKEVLTLNDKTASELLVNGVYILPVGIWIEKTGQVNEYEYTTRFMCHVERQQIMHYCKIFENIWLGSCPRLRSHIMDLKSQGITAVISLQTASDIQKHCSGIYRYNQNLPITLKKLYKEEGISYIWLPMEDLSTESRIENLPQGVYLLHGLLNNGHRVYVHCNGGVGRSTAIVCGFLMYVLHWSLAKVQYNICSKRPVAFIDGRALITAEKDFIQKFGQVKSRLTFIQE
ncbi:predicted protein [Nematostella vectensis]|uniref:Uncharacterized protein n=1 Tax=Nematostella vectensis TaxID=45351 RepID=A7SVW9_NEMVE|nr:laforin [Nematostella vectensis]EDO32135.1 predicted protein [Nematostella vectensis]|eukprot:XP_001624235.1 predicted protein [Nematostella vectensis]